MAVEARARAQRRDRWVSLAVVGVFALALILGWVLKMAAQGRSAVGDAGDTSVRYPSGWVRSETEAPVLFKAQDLWATPYRTTLTLERRPVPPDTVSPLSYVQSSLDLERGRTWTAYRTLQLDEPVTVEGRELQQEELATGEERRGMLVTFVYVEPNPNPFVETIPVVMQGEDYLFSAGDYVYVSTVTAAKENITQGQNALRALVHSLTLPE